MSSDVVDKIDGILEKNGTITKSNVKSNQKINTNLYFLDYNLVSATQEEYNEVIKYFDSFCTSYPMELDSTLLLSTDLSLDDFYEKVCEKEIDIFIIIDINNGNIRFNGISAPKTTSLLQLYY